MTENEYQSILAAQQGCCAICGSENAGGRPAKTTTDDIPPKAKMAVDHDHNAGKVRELLCSRCNWLVGVIETRAELVRAAIAYLKRHGKEPGI